MENSRPHYSPVTVDLATPLQERLSKFIKRQKPPFTPTKRAIIEAALSEYLDKMERKQ